MHRNDKSNFLLYIEPKKEEKLKEPIKDNLTELLKKALSFSKRGAANYSHINEPEKFYDDGWMGWHGTDCGERSDDNDFLLQNGLITNSLAPFYARWYRNSIHENDWNKLKQLADYYDVDIDIPSVFPNSPESTKPKTYEESMKEFQDMLVDDLAKSINENILKNIKKL